MANETRVNLKHLLEDLRDAYASSLEEVVITELVANALDSGASNISFSCESQGRAFRCIDNGEGMNRAQLRSYHNIAATTKERGFGIGFAGVGAKLALLVAERVLTESRGKHGTRCAAEWHLQNAYRAPWKFVPFSGLIKNGRGTSVTIFLKEEKSPLLDVAFVERTIKRHFYPLIVEHAGIRKILSTLYKKPITVTLNSRIVREEIGMSQDFSVHREKSRSIVGAGFLERASIDRNFWARFLGREPRRPQDAGLKISTYGKVIKGGWEWLGLSPKNPEYVSGVVEVPEMSQILTTNKADFLSDAGSLRKYYRMRKAVQAAVAPALRALGESRDEGLDLRTPAAWKPLTRDIESALSEMSRQFPELESLVGERFSVANARRGDDGSQERNHKSEINITPSESRGGNVREPTDSERDVESASGGKTLDTKGDSTKRVKKPGLSITFDAFGEKSERQLLGKLVKDIVYVNTAHPAWQTAQDLRQDHYHVVITVGLLLAEEVSPGKSAGEFLSAFLSAWSDASRGSKRLF